MADIKYLSVWENPHSYIKSEWTSPTKAYPSCVRKEKKHRNNGGPNNHAAPKALIDDLRKEADKFYNNADPETVTKRDTNGAFYRLGF